MASCAVLFVIAKIREKNSLGFMVTVSYENKLIYTVLLRS